MVRNVGTISRGIRCPIIREGDHLAEIVTESVLTATKTDGFSLQDRDVVAVTESIVARSQGNYATADAIIKDIRQKFGSGMLGLIFPILSRNRFATSLRAIAGAAEKVVLMFSYPSDEVGNHLVSFDQLDDAAINPYSDCLTLAEFREHFGYPKHEFTGVDYIEHYEALVREAGADCEVIFSNDARDILKYTDHVLTCDIHTRARTKRLLKKAGAAVVHGLDEILTVSIDGSGFNDSFGLLGSNAADETRVKLFPRDCLDFVKEVQRLLLHKTGKHVEVMVYGDGAFKDPQGKIWELADPCVSPGYTEGLAGIPHELKLKYLADHDYKELSGAALRDAISKSIRDKETDDASIRVDGLHSLGTTPRQITDLIGSLADLTSGSGDKGTPVVLVQGYFDNYIS